MIRFYIMLWGFISVPVCSVEGSFWKLQITLTNLFGCFASRDQTSRTSWNYCGWWKSHEAIVVRGSMDHHHQSQTLLDVIHDYWTCQMRYIWQFFKINYLHTVAQKKLNTKHVFFIIYMRFQLDLDEIAFYNLCLSCQLIVLLVYLLPFYCTVTTFK